MFHEAQGKNINIYSFKNYFIPLQFENQIYLSSGINNLDVPACVWHHQSRLIRRGHHFWSTVGSKTFLNQQFIFLQVVLCQSDLFYHQSRQNMTTNCSSNLHTQIYTNCLASRLVQIRFWAVWPHCVEVSLNFTPQQAHLYPIIDSKYTFIHI